MPKGQDAARVLDDVSDHLGEVLRHADALLDEWSRFGAQVQAQVTREAESIGAVVDDAVARAASTGIDRAIADRLSALTGELAKLETRARAAQRVVAEQRAGDRRVLWALVAGIVLANVLLVAIWLRKPEPPQLPPEPVRIESPAGARSGAGSIESSGSAGARNAESIESAGSAGAQPVIVPVPPPDAQPPPPPAAVPASRPLPVVKHGPPVVKKP